VESGLHDDCFPETFETAPFLRRAKLGFHPPCRFIKASVLAGVFCVLPRQARTAADAAHRRLSPRQRMATPTPSPFGTSNCWVPGTLPSSGKRWISCRRFKSRR
jgi:hypothetical protein